MVFPVSLRIGAIQVSWISTYHTNKFGAIIYAQFPQARQAFLFFLSSKRQMRVGARKYAVNIPSLSAPETSANCLT